MELFSLAFAYMLSTKRYTFYSVIKICCVLVLCTLWFTTAVFAQVPEVHELKSKVFNNSRHIWVYLPPGYRQSAESYPVLYMNDGVATFHAYNLQHVVDSLIDHKIIKPLIIVGIDNGASVAGSTNLLRDRANEYLPWHDLNETVKANQIESPQGSKYPAFLFDDVMPLVNRLYRTKQGPENTGLGGASYGALIALYTAIHNPGKIGTLLLESPSLYVDNHHILTEAKQTAVFPDTYVGIGTNEGATEATMAMALTDAEHLYTTIHENNKSKAWLEVTAGAGHNFNAFAKRFPLALKYLYGISK